jgi:hypothetical protein
MGGAVWKATFCRVDPFLFSQYIAHMLWRVRNSRGRPINATAWKRAGVQGRSNFDALVLNVFSFARSCPSSFCLSPRFSASGLSGLPLTS